MLCPSFVKISRSVSFPSSRALSSGNPSPSFFFFVPAEALAMAIEEVVAAVEGQYAADAAEPLAIAPVKARKAKAPKEPKAKNPSAPRKSRSPSAHPPYVEMIGDAIAALKERTGSSQYAIGKFIEDKHNAHLPPNFKKLLLVQLKKLTASGKLTKVKNSFKLAAKPKPVSSAVPAKLMPSAAAAKPKPKISAASKPRAKPKTVAVATMTKTKSAATAKPKQRPASKAAKPKAGARPAKAVKTSAKDAPVKKAARAAKPAAAPRKRAVPAVRKPKSMKSVGKAAAKKAPARKPKK